MFYKAIGYATWTGAKWYIKRRMSGTLKVGVALAVVTVVATAYLAARGDGDGDQDG